MATKAQLKRIMKIYAASMLYQNQLFTELLTEQEQEYIYKEKLKLVDKLLGSDTTSGEVDEIVRRVLDNVL